MKARLEKFYRSRATRWCRGLLLVPFLTLSAHAQSNTIPIFQFAAFYNSLLELTWCPPMTFNGRVHVNGDIYTGTAWQVTFNAYVSTTGSVSSPAWDGRPITNYTKPVLFNTPCLTNASPLTLFTGTPNTPDNAREIINMPPPGGDTNAALAALRYYNKAGVVLLISNSTITTIIKSSMSDPAPLVTIVNYYPTNNSWTNYSALTNNFPFLTATNFWPSNSIPAGALMTDQRENAKLILTDIDTAKLNHWLFTNAAINAKFPNTNGVYASATNAPNILYVANNRSYSNGWLTAVRLKNATTIPTNLFNLNGGNTPSGFTFATPNPLYVWGNYNVPNSAYYGSTNTAAAGDYPASLISDALTILSGNWVDSQSALSLLGVGKNKVTAATDVTLNAAIITGIVYSTGPAAPQYSGGIHDIFRLLEDWGSGNNSIVLTMNGALVCLFNSARATNQFQSPGVYFEAPTRQFSFDPNLLVPSKLPPGTPVVGPAAPCILSSPQDKAAVAGQSAMFCVSNNGATPLSYQWFYNETNAISGATNATLILTDLDGSDAGDYSVTITNTYGSVTSDIAALTIGFPPVINPPLTNLVVLVGQDATFTADASGDAPLSFQWQFNGANLDGATDSALSLTNISLDLAGEYSVLVTNLVGETTNSALLSVYATAAATLTAAPSPDGSEFQLTISGVPGFNYVVEASTNFIEWDPILTNTSPFVLTDDDFTNYPARFYRSVYQP